MGLSWRHEFRGEAAGCGRLLIDWGKEKSGRAAGILGCADVFQDLSFWIRLGNWRGWVEGMT